MSSRITLAIRHADGTVQEHTVPSGSYTLGRGEDCDIVLKSIDVSNHHVRITLGMADCQIEDLRSTHGTMVNGQVINGPFTCPYPARLQLASVTLEIKVAPAGSPGRWKPPSKEDMGRLLPEYRIEKLIGRGGMGAVYKATQLSLDRPVAIKILPTELSQDTEFTSRFEREARTLGQFVHPGIVQVYKFGRTASEGHLYFVMEFIDGTDLRHLIKAGNLKPDLALELVGQICEALLVAHRQGVIHRDIKPENILITKDGRVKLVDFGLARPVHEDVSRLTNPNVVMGTPDYMSPEQFLGLGDQRTDIFALGVVLYEMLTGKPPSGAFDVPSSKVQMDVRIDEVVFKALQHEPERRYQDVSEMKSALDHIRTTQPVSAGPTRSAAKASSQATTVPKRRKGKLLIIGAGMLALGYAGWFLSRERHPEQAQPKPGSKSQVAAVVAPVVVQPAENGDPPPAEMKKNAEPAPSSSPPQPKATAAQPFNGWEIRKVGERDYVTAETIRDFYNPVYGFSTFRRQDDNFWLGSSKLILKAKIGSQEMLINNIKFILNNKVIESEGKVLFSRLDLTKIIDPVLYPSHIQNAKPFDTVVIDPSGGGHDSGARGVYGYEKDFALKMAMSVRAVLLQRGLKVILTRATDTFITLGGRIAIANQTPRSIYIGLQYNAGEDDDTGVETHALSPQGTLSELGFTGNARDSENIALATAIHATVTSRFKLVDRGIVHSNRGELAGLRVPGVVFIGGYVTNAKECQLIASESYRQQLSAAIGDAVMNYRKALESATSGKPTQPKTEPAKVSETSAKPAGGPERDSVPAGATSSPPAAAAPMPAEALPKVPAATQPQTGNSKHPWKQDIAASVFWIGEPGGSGTATRNSSSSWDPLWEKNFGGVDDPKNRTDQFSPAGFVPQLNPFYVALPYNDVLSETTQKPEAAKIIPWFQQRFTQPGKSVLKDRWVMIRFGNRVCYAQWEDCGPVLTDDHDYVFGSAGPRNTANGGAGLEISPAVRDYLGMAGGGKCDWRFVDLNEIPEGPWRKLGGNNDFLQAAAANREATAARLEELRQKRDEFFKKDGAAAGSKSSKTIPTDNSNAAEKDTHKTPATATVEAYPTAKVVPGKPGLVFSPFVNTQAMIDVRDMKSGQKVKCPFTQKLFLVLDSD